MEVTAMVAHENLERPDGVRLSSNRVFGFIFAGLFLILALLPFLFDKRSPNWWAAGASCGFAAAALLFPKSLGPLNRMWFRLSMLLHRVVSLIVLWVMFYLVVLPTGLVLRVLGKDPLQLRFDPRTLSYWIKRNPPGPRVDTFRDQF